MNNGIPISWVWVRETEIVLETGSLKNCRWQWSTLNNLNILFCFITTKWAEVLCKYFCHHPFYYRLRSLFLKTRYYFKMPGQIYQQNRTLHAQKAFPCEELFLCLVGAKNIDEAGMAFFINIFTPTPIFCGQNADKALHLECSSGSNQLMKCFLFQVI